MGTHRGVGAEGVNWTLAPSTMGGATAAWTPDETPT